MCVIFCGYFESVYTMLGGASCDVKCMVFQHPICEFFLGVDAAKIPSQQRGSLPIPQVPIRLTNVWCGRLDGIMAPLPF